MSEIYLAGGCFWGTEKYLSLINGVIETEVGYANGDTKNPTYQEVCNGSNHAEVVKVLYDESKISLSFLLELFYESINPFTINKQGNDEGPQYRSGIYFTDIKDKVQIEESIKQLENRLNRKVVIEVKEVENYYKAESYHQAYLDKNPLGYCHINPKLFRKAALIKVDPTKYEKTKKEELKNSLSDLEYEVTMNNATEPPHNNKFDKHFEEGIYVDITTGEPLFSSNDKFDSHCGWPSFSSPIDPLVVIEELDNSLGMKRVEVRSRVGDAHLGHVFDDGPKEKGGLRFCINSASLRFIPKKDLEKEGYGYLNK